MSFVGFLHSYVLFSSAFYFFYRFCFFYIRVLLLRTENIYIFLILQSSHLLILSSFLMNLNSIPILNLQFWTGYATRKSHDSSFHTNSLKSSASQSVGLRLTSVKSSFVIYLTAPFVVLSVAILSGAFESLRLLLTSVKSRGLRGILAFRFLILFWKCIE